MTVLTVSDKIGKTEVHKNVCRKVKRDPERGGDDAGAACGSPGGFQRHGGKREPNYETLNALSGIFDKRIDYILGYSNDSSSARLSEEQIEQLGAWMVEDDAQEEFMDIMALDNYGRMAVHGLVMAEKARCREQGTLIPTDNVEVTVRLREKR